MSSLPSSSSLSSSSSSSSSSYHHFHHYHYYHHHHHFHNYHHHHHCYHTGESLLNDGSAMIMYLFFGNLIGGAAYSPGAFFEFVLRMLILSPTIGGRLIRSIFSNNPLNYSLSFNYSIIYPSIFLCIYISILSSIYPSIHSIHPSYVIINKTYRLWLWPRRLPHQPTAHQSTRPEDGLPDRRVFLERVHFLLHRTTYFPNQVD